MSIDSIILDFVFILNYNYNFNLGAYTPYELRERYLYMEADSCEDKRLLCNLEDFIGRLYRY